MRVNYYKLKKNLYLYKNQNIYFDSNNNQDNDLDNTSKLKGRLILIPSTNSNNFFDYLKSNVFIKEYIKGYFIPKLDRLTSCRNKRVVDNQEVRYNEIKDKISTITFRRKFLNLYNNYNVYFDCYPYFQLFNSTFISKTFNPTKFEKFDIFIKEVLSKAVSNYDEVIIHIIPSNLITTGKEYSLENYLYYHIRNKDLDLDFFKKFQFVFSNNTGSKMFKLDFSDFDYKTFKIVKFKNYCNILYKLSNNIQLSKEDLSDISTEELKSVSNKTNEAKPKEIKNNSVINDEVIQSKTKVISDKKKKVDSKIKKSSVKVSKVDEDNITYDNSIDSNEIDVSNDKNYIQYLISLKDGNTTISETKRRQLQEKQAKVTIEVKENNKTSKSVLIDDIIKDNSVHEVEKDEIKVDTLNKEVKTCTLHDLDKNYVKNQKDKDLLKVLSAFNDDPECPMYITKFSRTDISTELDKKELIRVTYEDGWGNSHNLSIELPIVYDNSFMYLNENKISIGKQLMKLPITKNKSNEVCISTDYNKMFFWRFNQKLSSNTDKLKNFINKDAPNYKSIIKVKLGNALKINSNYQTIMEYDEASKYMLSTLIDNDILLCFNRETVNDEVAEFLNYAVDDAIPKNEYLLGCIKSNNIIFTINNVDGLIHLYAATLNEAKLTATITHNSIFDLYLECFRERFPELYKKLLNQKTSTKFMYVRTKVTGTYIPLIILCGFYFGLENVMERYGIQYEFSEKKKQLDNNEVSTWSSIRFQDGYLNYKSMPLRNSLLMNGLNDIPTLRETEFSKLNSKEVYIDYFDYRYGKRNLAKGFSNSLNFLLDPKTKQVLEYLKLPNDLLGVLLYCNTLLDNNSCIPPNSMKNYRLRSVETVNATLYKVLANAVKEYKDAYKSGYHDRKIALHSPDAVIKELVDSPINESYSTLSPVLEIEKLGTTTYKGIGGTNLLDAFTPEIRSYDKSMVGLLGVSSPDSNKVGVTRQLSYSPKITNDLGFIDTETDVNDMDATNMMTAGELLSCYTSLHADPPRKFWAA